MQTVQINVENIQEGDILADSGQRVRSVFQRTRKLLAGESGNVFDTHVVVLNSKGKGPEVFTFAEPKEKLLIRRPKRNIGYRQFV